MSANRVADPVLSFKVENVGESPLSITGLDEVIGDSVFTVLNATPRTTLEPGESLDLKIVFNPPSYGQYEAVIAPSVGGRLDLSGEGSAPRFELSPDALVFPSTPIGCESTTSLQLANSGDEPLLLHDLQLSGSPDISLLTPPPEVLNPGDVTELDLYFRPSVSGQHAGTLQIHTNDPSAETAALPMEGLAYEGESFEETFNYSPWVRSDFLFVVDSTLSVRSRLMSSLHLLDDWFYTLEDRLIDWRYTVTNGDIDCHATPEPWIDINAGVEDAVEAMTAAFGIYGEGDSSLLELALGTLERTDKMDCLSGFIREASQLHVVLITDRLETSPETVDYYLGAIANRLGSGGELVISALAGDGSACPEATAALQAADMTNGAIADICTSEWPKLFTNIAAISTSNNSSYVSYTLGGVPVPETIEVLAGDRLLDSWSYDTHTNTLSLNGTENNISIGESLTVRYLAEIECP